MKNAQAKIDTLLDLLVDSLQDRIATAGEASDVHLAQLERLITLSNLNNKRKELVEKPGPQSRTTTLTDDELVRDLKAARDPDLFPRRGPRKGKRENPGKPLPPEPPFCAIHTGVIATPNAAGVPICAECVEPPEQMLSLKDLISR